MSSQYYRRIRLQRTRARWARTLLVAFITLTCLKVWFGPDNLLPAATAQIPDSGLQRKQIVDEIRITNQLLNQILDTLKTHTIKVRIQGTDNKQEGKARGSGR